MVDAPATVQAIAAAQLKVQELEKTIPKSSDYAGPTKWSLFLVLPVAVKYPLSPMLQSHLMKMGGSTIDILPKLRIYLHLDR